MYDVIIIGKGPAGISAALYTARANINTLIIGKDDSAIYTASKIENYYGFTQAISGNKLFNDGITQIKNFGVEIINEEVIDIKYTGEYEVVTTANKFISKSLILATGQKQKKMKIENIVEKFEGKGISYCTTCDGFFFRGKKLGVIGQKDFAVYEADELSSFTDNITIYSNGKEFDLSDDYKRNIQKYKQNKKRIRKFEGIEKLSKLIFDDDTEEEIDGVFIANEGATSIDFARKLGILINQNSITVDKYQTTNIGGLFAAGDCTGGFRQIATAVGEGAVAGRSVIEYIRKREI